MYQKIIGTGRRAVWLPWHHARLQRSFAISVPRNHWQIPENRQSEPYRYKHPRARLAEYETKKEKYRTDPAYRAKILLDSTIRFRARLALLSEDEKHQRNLLERFRRLVKHRLKQGRLPHWKNHVPEFVDESLACHCTSCGRVHYKGRAKIWWKSKFDGEYEVSTEKAI